MSNTDEKEIFMKYYEEFLKNEYEKGSYRKKKSPLRYFGGKYYLAPWIISLLPAHKTYIEVFGGSAGLLFIKEKSFIEVYNDIDKNLVNFFRVLREKPFDLFKKLYFSLYSRAEFDLALEKIKEKTYSDDVDWAAAVFYVSIMSFGGFRLNNTFGYARERSFDELYKKINGLKTFHKRIKNITIECLDFKEVIKKYDYEDALFYCDPPYFSLEKNYYNDFSFENHYILAETLENIKGKFILSYNSNELLERLYPKAKFFHFSKLFSNSIVNTLGTKTRSYRKEFLITNFNPNSTRRFGQNKTKKLEFFLKE